MRPGGERAGGADEGRSEAPFARVKSSQRFERNWNRLQVSIEIAVALVVVAGLVGLFGTGPTSKASMTVPGRRMTIDYDRIGRRTVQTDMTITFADLPAHGRLDLELPTAFQREMDIVSTSPRSSEMRVADDGVVYVFDLGETGRGEITLSMKPKRPGLFSSRLVLDGTSATLHQLVWP